MVDDAVARIIAVAIRLAQHGSDQARVFLPADEARYLTVRGDASRRDLCHDGENLVNQIFVQDFSHRIALVFAFAFKVAGLIADPGSAASPEKHRRKTRACQGCLAQLLARRPSAARPKCGLLLLEKDAEDVLGDGGAADDPHEFALVINHGKLFELLLRQ